MNFIQKYKKVIYALVSLVIIGFISLYILAPYISLLGIKNAIETKNKSELSKYVNFPKLRENIKKQIPIRSYMTSLGGFGDILNDISSKVIDNYITIDSVDRLLNGKTATPSFMDIMKDNKDESNKKPILNISQNYKSLNEFHIIIDNNLEIDFKIKIILKRKLFSFELVNIIIPIKEWT